MGQKSLVEKQVSDGDRLVKALDAHGVNVKAALWLYDSEMDNWELRILLRDFDLRADPREFYRCIAEVFWSEQPALSFDIADIRVVETDDPVMRARRVNAVFSENALYQVEHRCFPCLSAEFVNIGATFALTFSCSDLGRLAVKFLKSLLYRVVEAHLESSL